MRNKDKNKMSIETGLWTMNMDYGGRTFGSFAAAVRLIRMESAHAFGVRFDCGLLLEPEFRHTKCFTPSHVHFQ